MNSLCLTIDSKDELRLKTLKMIDVVGKWSEEYSAADEVEMKIKLEYYE